MTSYVKGAVAQLQRLVTGLDRLPIRRQAEAVAFLARLADRRAGNATAAVRLRLLEGLLKGGFGKIHPDDLDAIGRVGPYLEKAVTPERFAPGQEARTQLTRLVRGVARPARIPELGEDEPLPTIFRFDPMGGRLEIFRRAIWLAAMRGDEEEARRLFQLLFYRRGVPRHGKIADLGSGCGLHGVRLAWRYPRATIYTVDLNPILRFEDGVPSNVVNAGGCSFASFLALYKALYGRLGDFHRVYIVMPSPSSWWHYIDTADQLVGPQGEIQLVTESGFVIGGAAEELRRRGYRLAQMPIPYVAAATDSDFLWGLHEYPPDELYWLMARKRSTPPAGVGRRS